MVRVSVSNDTGRVVDVLLRDDPPPGFHVDRDRFRCTLAPQETWSGTYHVTPTQRGDHAFGDLNLRIRTVLGLLIRQRSVAANETVRVYPDLRQVRQYEMLARQRRASMMGIRRLRPLGSGHEFEQLRDYQPDDEVRHIDWKASARRGALMVREFAVERSQQVVLALDLGHTMATRFGGPVQGRSRPQCVRPPRTRGDRVRGSGRSLHLRGSARPVDRPGTGTAPDAQPGGSALPGPRPAGSHRLWPRVRRARGPARERSLVILFTDLVDPDSSRRLIEPIGVLARRHLVLCVAFGDYELQALIPEWPERGEDLYRQAVAASMVEDRQRALSALAHHGVLTLDATRRI